MATARRLLELRAGLDRDPPPSRGSARVAREGFTAAMFVATLIMSLATCELDKLVTSAPGPDADTSGPPGTPGAPGSPTPVSVNVVAGDDQRDTVAATLPLLYAVQVIDAGGRGVGGIPVTWSIPPGTGAVEGMPATDLQGRAYARRTLGTIASTQITTATVAMLAGASVTFSAVASAGTPAQLLFAQQPVTVRSKATISPAVTVQVRDQFGNATSRLAGEIGIAIVTGTGTPGAKLSGDRTRTPANGVASFNDLKVDRPGWGFVLRASGGGLAIDSDQFLVF